MLRKTKKKPIGVEKVWRGSELSLKIKLQREKEIGMREKIEKLNLEKYSR